jgi:prepilin peptidase CpaA
MTEPFFPDPGFAWVFFIALILILTAAAYFDLRYLTIPKWLTITTLVLGIVINVVRVSFMTPDNPVWGGLEGLGFALLGFAAGFGLFVFLWIMGLCGGGDVKLFAAVAAWLGWKYFCWLCLGTIVTLIVISMARLGYSFVFAGRARTRRAFFHGGGTTGKTGTSLKSRQRLLPYSLPLAVAAVIMLLWIFRWDLKLAERPAQSARMALLKSAWKG